MFSPTTIRYFFSLSLSLLFFSKMAPTTNGKNLFQLKSKNSTPKANPQFQDVVNWWLRRGRRRWWKNLVPANASTTLFPGSHVTPFPPFFFSDFRFSFFFFWSRSLPHFFLSPKPYLLAFDYVFRHLQY